MPEGLSRCLPASPKTSHLTHMPSVGAGGVAKGLEKSHHPLPALSFALCSPPKENANYGGQRAAALTHLPASQHSPDLKPRPPHRAERPALPCGAPRFKAEGRHAQLADGLPVPSSHRLPTACFSNFGNLKGRSFGIESCFSKLEKHCFNYFGYVVGAECL